jgi:hypothetical protein
MPRWTPEARRKQAEIQKTRQSWRHSTGPKTREGKARASMNAWKHGMRSAPARRLRTILRRQSHFLKQVNAYLYVARRSLSPSLRGVRRSEAETYDEAIHTTVPPETWHGLLRYARNDEPGGAAQGTALLLLCECYQGRLFA